MLNSAGGGAALSTLGLIESLWAEGVASCAVCDDIGTDGERATLRDAVRGEVTFTQLYWWNRKNRLPLWRRPLAQAKQIMVTGWARSSAARVARFARQTNCDLIHTNTILTPEGGLAARQLGLPHVWHLREMVGPGHPFRFYQEGPAFGRHVGGLCSKLIANSHASAAQVSHWLPPGLLEIVPNGIDISQFQPRATAKTDGPTVVAMVGNLTSQWKKHTVFAAAAAKVDRALPIRWRFYGKDPSQGGAIKGDAYMDALHAQIARAGLTDRFDWPGFMTDPVEIMSQVDILVHPADSESFGRVVVEAMAAGLPVVGVRGGGVGEIVRHGETGFLADVDDAGALAGYIQQLARDPAQRLAMGQAGRRRAEDVYSLTACAAGVLRVYEQAMDRTGRRGSTTAAAATAHIY